MAKSGSPFFVGYGTLEGLAAVMDKAQSVQSSALQVVVSGPSSPVETRKQVIMVSQIAGNEVRYCRFAVGYVQFFNGQPWNQDYDERKEGFVHTHSLVNDWLKEQGFKVVDATVSHTKGLELVEGDIGFLGYDKDTNRFYRKA
jgi:hypothetical protein